MSLLLKHSSNPAQVEAFDCQLAKLQHKYMQIASTSSLINAVIVRTSLLKEDRKSSTWGNVTFLFLEHES